MNTSSVTSRFPAVSGLLLSLYLCQGLPSGFMAHALPALMRDQGISNTAISALKLLALPWFLKVLWAPLVDNHGNRRQWILAMQATIIALLVGIAALDISDWITLALPMLFLLLLAVNAGAATQDIATDGLAVRALPPDLRGWGNGLQVGGYKLGMLVGGSGFLLVVGTVGWQGGFITLALLLVLMSLPVIHLKAQVLTCSPHASLVDHTAPTDSIWKVLRSALAEPHWQAWLPVLLVYKMGDAFASGMIKPMLVDQGWTMTGLGSLTLVSTVVGIIAALMAGEMYRRIGARRALLGFCLLQTIGIAAYLPIALMELPVAWVYAIALFEQFADALSTVALFAIMMGHCRVGHEGTDYTLQTSLQVMVGGTVALFSGWVADSLGYGIVFGLGALMGVLALAISWRFFSQQNPDYLNRVV